MSTRGLAGALILGVAVAGCGATSTVRSAPPRPRSTLPVAPPRPVQTPKHPRTWLEVGDVNGDGNSDRARILNLRHPSSVSSIFGWTYRLEVRLSTGGEVSATFAGDPPDPGSAFYFNTHVIGGSDVNGDGRREVFVQVAHGASTAVVSPFRLVDARLVQISEGGSPTLLDVNGSVTHLDGFSCHPPVLVIWGETATADGKAYRQTVGRYRISDTALVLLSTAHRRVPAARAQDGDFIRCTGLPGAA